MVCTVLYVAPFKPWGKQVDRYATKYMYPYFYQGWKLFAPDVREYHYLIDYRYFQENQWSEFNAVHELDGIANKPRLQKIEHKLLVHLMRDISKSVDFDNEVLDFAPVLGSMTYGRVALYTFRRHRLAHDHEPDSMQLQLRTRYAPEFMTDLTIDDRIYVFPAFATNYE